MVLIESVQELEDHLSAPSAQDQEAIRRIAGDIIILGAGGKMGPLLARRVKRAANAAGSLHRVVAVSRFSSPDLALQLEREGIETLACDLSSRDAVAKLPDCPNVLYLVGRKFGSSGRPDLTWMTNTVLPSYVADRYRASKVVAFSTGNVYPFVPVESGGSVESDAPSPVGEYAQSCLGRERVFEHFSLEYCTPCVLYRLNYAVELRYGVLVDIARKVFTGEPVNLAVPAFNAIWQGDANSYALRSLELCTSPARILKVTGQLETCPHPDWRDAALLTVDTGMRPADEVCKLRWEAVELNGHGGRIRIDEARTLAGRRVIPLKAEVYEHFGIPDPALMLKERLAAQGYPTNGWVFPRPTQSGHLTESTYKVWHSKALKTLAEPCTENSDKLKIEPFEPYCLRHTFLTWLAPHLDVFALARLAGNTSIRTTQRYVHPAEETLEDSLARLGGHKIGHTRKELTTR